MFGVDAAGSATAFAGSQPADARAAAAPEPAPGASRSVELMLISSAIPFLLLFFVGLVVFAGFVPPPSPARSADEVAAFYRTNTGGIQVGLALCFISTIPYLMFGAGLLGQTRRITGVSPAVGFLQLAAFSAGLFVFLVPIVAWWAAAFRAETRSPELIQGLNDFGCLLFVGGFPPFVTWCFATGLAILSDTSPTPLFPRWSAYASFFVAFIQIPPVLLVGFYRGPFAWDGLLSWWVPLTEFFTWVVVMTTLGIRAVDRGRPWRR